MIFPLCLAGVDYDAVYTCMENSGFFNDTTPNILMQAEVALRENLLIVNLPTVTVNGQIERGTV